MCVEDRACANITSMHCKIHDYTKYILAVELEGCKLIPRFCPGFPHLQYRPANKAKLFKHHSYLIGYTT